MGPEFIDFRVMSSGWYQVPVVYGWTDVVAGGGLPDEIFSTAEAPAGDARGDLAG
jgi:hypothetical protein